MCFINIHCHDPKYPRSRPQIPQTTTPNTPGHDSKYPRSRPQIPQTTTPNIPDHDPKYPRSRPQIPQITTPNTPDHGPKYPRPRPQIPQITTPNTPDHDPKKYLPLFTSLLALPSIPHASTLTSLLLSRVTAYTTNQLLPSIFKLHRS
ncbi:hypothetical protein Pmani_037029 [Petrolisthes manimaculis]|uniref:Uncharacterized protein n=1 Tax=Petrolisthes manimaculis TaxID=1843537 RepID=A0AAE1NIJ6_9EUCA|nr:hypothetical protein Pmani_037029 [Petrolisthes manimaculis]